MLRNNSDARRYSYFDLDSLELPAMEVPQFASTIYQSQNYKQFYNFLSLLQKAPM